MAHTKKKADDELDEQDEVKPKEDKESPDTAPTAPKEDLGTDAAATPAEPGPTPPHKKIMEEEEAAAKGDAPDEKVKWKGKTYDVSPYDEVRIGQDQGRNGVEETWCRLVAMNNMDDALDVPVDNVQDAREFQNLARTHLRKREWQ
jgi:hypothetical protein